jgi:phage tail-like protein
MSFTAPQLPNQEVLSSNSFVVRIDGLDVDFTSFSGLEETYERGEYYDGVSNRKRYTNGGTISVEDVTLECPYSLQDNKKICDWMNTFRDGNKSDITVRPVRYSSSGGITILNTAFRLGNCRVKSYKPFSDLKKDSSDASMSELSFTVEYFTIT